MVDDSRTGILRIIWAMAAVGLAIHVAGNLTGGYGFFRDELYFLACSDHLAAGYVDHPPLSVFILAFARLLLGSSLFAVRLTVALAGAGAIVLIGLITRELGGGRRAVFFACLAALVSPIHLGMANIFSMNAFDILIWAAAIYVFIRLTRTGHRNDWLLLGVLLGLGLLNKTSVFWLGAGVAAAILLIAPLRRQLTTVWPYLSAAIALAIFSPFLIWNVAYDYPHLEFMRYAMGEKYASQTPWTFLTGAILTNNLFTAPLWIGGLVFLLFGRQPDQSRRNATRAVFVIFTTVLVILLLNFHTKAEYLAPAMSAVFAGGGLAVERLLAGRWGKWAASGYAVLILFGGIIGAPFVLPILPVDSYVAYANSLGMRPSTAEGKELADLPQFYADMFGWEEKAEAVARVFGTLHPDERSKCAIYAENYGRCGAIDYFGPRYGLPRSIGGHNSYWLWGPRDYTGELVIVLGGDLEDLKAAFQSVELAGVSAGRHCMPYENNLPIYICRHSKRPLKQLWPSTKSYG